jgi:hypothetical protein
VRVSPTQPTGLCLALAGLLAIPEAIAAPASVLVEIPDTGAYRLSYEQIAAVVPEMGEIDSGLLRLSTRGEPRAIHVHDGGDGRFGPGDSVSFHAVRLSGPQSWFDTYAVNNVYRLDFDGSAALSPASPAASTGAMAALRRSLHLEEENLQIRLNNRWIQPGEEPDLWFWSKLTQIDPEPFRSQFDLPDLSTGGGTVDIELGFRGLSEVRAVRGSQKPADHVVEIRVNDALVTTVEFESRNEFRTRLSLPAHTLAATGNTLELRVPQRRSETADALVDVVMFDFVDVDYPLDTNLSHALLPLTVQGGGSVAVAVAGEPRELALYGKDGSRHLAEKRNGHWHLPALAPGEYQPVPDGHYREIAAIRTLPASDWHNVDQGYDYLLVSHPSLQQAARPLAEHHRSQGLRVAEVDVTHLYDQFNHGIVHPRAIRDFVAHAYHHWPAPRPRFVLLVGDASFDIRSDRAEDARYAKWANMELLIPGQFGTIPGGMYEGTDKLAARRNLIPTWQYPSEEGHSAADNYFVAVDGDDWLPDLALGRFPVVEPEEVEAIVAKTIRYATRVDFGDWRMNTLFTTDTTPHFQSESTRLADSLVNEGFLSQRVYADADAQDNEPQINALNEAINEGQLLVHFIGHGGRYIWRTGPPDLTRNHDLFTLDHVAQLNNGDRLPMVLSMTCYSAPFDHPSADSIGERFLREPGKGAIAVFAASWRNSPAPAFSDAAVRELMVPGATIGEALMRAKHAIPNQWQRTLVETYNLLGDPAVVLKRPSLPLQLRVQERGGRSSLELATEQAVNGRATVQWMDQDGQLLAQRQLEMRGRTARVEAPAEATTATEIRVHLADYASRSDGIGRLDLVALAEAARREAEAEAERTRLAALPPPTPRDRSSVDEADVITYSGLDSAH